MISGIVLLILAGICWVAIGIAVSRCAATGLNYNIVQMISSAGAALISVPVLFLSGGRPELPGKILLAVFLLHFGAGVANYFNYVLTARAMRLGHNGIVWGMMQSGLLAPFLMGVLFFNVPLPLGRVLGIAAILCGILLLGVTRDPGAGRRSSSRARWLIPAFGAFLLAGVTQCCNSLPSYWKIVGVAHFQRAFAVAEHRVAAEIVGQRHPFRKVVVSRAGLPVPQGVPGEASGDEIRARPGAGGNLRLRVRGGRFRSGGVEPDVHSITVSRQDGSGRMERQVLLSVGAETELEGGIGVSVSGRQHLVPGSDLRRLIEEKLDVADKRHSFRPPVGGAQFRFDRQCEVVPVALE